VSVTEPRPAPIPGRRPGRLVLVVILVVLVRSPQQVQPVVDGLIALVGLTTAWDAINTRKRTNG
jgi:hypothetical protein